MATWSTASRIPTLIHLSGNEIQTTPRMVELLVKLLICISDIKIKSVCESVMLAAASSGPVVAKHLRTRVDTPAFYVKMP